MNNIDSLPDNAILRIDSVIGDKKKGKLGVYNVSRSHWYEGVKSGKYPQPVKLGIRAVGWKVSDIRALLAAQNHAA